MTSLLKKNLAKIKIKTENFFASLHIRKKPASNQSKLINKLLASFKKPTAYLEIGVDRGQTFENITSETKHGVDPYGTCPGITHRMTSEMFFVLNRLFYKSTYDVIFIDASHISLITSRELEQSMRILNKNGFVVLHDTDPATKQDSELVVKDIEQYLRNVSYPYRKSHTDSLVWTSYNGDVWKSVALLRMNKPNVKIFTVKNYCCTVVKKGRQKSMLDKVAFDKLNWNFLIKNRKRILNTIKFNEVDKYL